MGYWHITFSSLGRLGLFRGEAARRIAVRCIVRLAGNGLLLFCVVDDHVHIVIECFAERVRVLAGAVVRGLRAIAASPVADPHIRPVDRRTHLAWLVEYTVDQTTHHGLETHPALWSGSCFQDLVGARVIGVRTARLREALPRLSGEQLFRMVGLPVIEGATDEELRRAGPSRIVSAASAVIAADPQLSGRAADVVTARQIAAHVGRDVKISRADMAWALRVTNNCVGKLARRGTVDPRFVDAVRRQIALEHAVASIHVAKR